MGLLGFFVGIVGFGAMAKDATEKHIINDCKYNKAVTLREKTYKDYIGVERSVITGNQTNLILGDERNVIIDSVTKETLVDITSKHNEAANRRSRARSAVDGNQFYKTYEFTNKRNHSSHIYINDNMPNKYFVEIIDYTIPGNVYYTEAEIIKKVGRDGVTYISAKPINNKLTSTKFRKDGTLINI